MIPAIASASRILGLRYWKTALHESQILQGLEVEGQACDWNKSAVANFGQCVCAAPD